MQIAKFEYIDAKKKVTQRTVAVISMPSNLMTAIDVSELSPEQVKQFAEQHNALKDKYKAALLALQAEFDLTHNLRFFKVENISNQESEYV
jgi:hypothetical protein